jgi:hypothetical protein
MRDLGDANEIRRQEPWAVRVNGAADGLKIISRTVEPLGGLPDPPQVAALILDYPPICALGRPVHVHGLILVIRDTKCQGLADSFCGALLGTAVGR